MVLINTKSNLAFWITVLLILAFLTPVVYGEDPNSPITQTIPIPYPLTVLLRNASVHQELELNLLQKNAVAVALNKVELPLFQIAGYSGGKAQSRRHVLSEPAF